MKGIFFKAHTYKDGKNRKGDNSYTSCEGEHEERVEMQWAEPRADGFITQNLQRAPGLATAD